MAVDLTNPAFAVLGENRARVLSRLAVLAEPVSGRRIHELSGVKSLRTVQSILDDLETLGLVVSERVGAANAYELNREHVMWEPIEDILNSVGRAESSVAEILEGSVGNRARATFLYGSAARGEAGVDSDIDILVVWEEQEPPVDAAELLDNAATRIERKTGNRVQLLPMSGAELLQLTDDGDPLIQSLRSDARWLTGGTDFASLVKELRA